MPAKPMLDDVELQQVQKIESEDEAAVQQHSIPALEGDFLQDLGRRSTRIDLTGVLTGPDAGKGLQKLREKFQKAEPMSFVADIATATVVDKVMIEQMEVEELAGKPERFAYALSVLEFVPPPEPETEPPPPPPPPPPKVDTGTLVVEVIVTGKPDFDFSTVTVTVKGTKDGGDTFKRTLSNRKDNVWTDEAMPPGSYKAKAETTAPIMNGTADAKIQAGQTTKVTITLTPGGVVATEFIVTFRFDKAFVEPCMRQVLKQVIDFSNRNEKQKLLIVGHTDLVGSPDPPSNEDPYNQSLSERRARAVYAFLTFGRDQKATDAAVADWNALRQKQSGSPSKPTLADNWGTREYQYMLQDLGFYPGAVDGKEGKKTQEAVRAFRCHSGLPPGTVMDDPAWDRLIRAYLGQDNFALPDDRFLRNCGTDPLKWIGCASQDSVDPKKTAHRPNRRVELLFTTDSKLPCDVPQPDTFDLPTSGAIGSAWCVGPGDKKNRACFVVRHLAKDPKPKDKEWTRVLTEPGTIEVQVSIKKEVKNADSSIELKPAPGEKFVIVTGDGHFLKSEQSRGEPNPDTTSADGTKKYSDQALGFYSIEIEPKADGSSVMVQLEGEPGASAKGNEVCKHLTANDTTLNVVILLDPVLRQIKLPAAAHMMRALHPATRAIRRCQAIGRPPGVTHAQVTLRDKPEVQAAFAAANEIWRQARIRFDLTDVFEEAYAFSTECELTDQEFTVLLQRCAYPKVANAFFVGKVSSNTRPSEPGKGDPETGLAVAVPGGCAVADFLPLVDSLIADAQTAQTLAHELGHYLTLDDTSSDSVDEQRLMFPAVGINADRKLLTPDEIATARASAGAAFECIPLSMDVTGATQVGGSLSHEFIVIQDPSKTVTVKAVISDELLAVGTVTMTGGDPGANERERTVSGATAAPPVEIVATYTPNSGGDVITTRRVVSVVTFDLRVEGDGGKQIDATTFVFPRAAAGKRATIIADLQPPLFCVPENLVVWKGGDDADDFLRHTIPLNATASAQVSATIAGATKTVTIVVFEVALVANDDPFGAAIRTVQIEGVLNRDLKNFDLTNLFDIQPRSLFRARATLPSVAGNTLQAELIHKPADGSAAKKIPITLTKRADAFLSAPILAIPIILKDEIQLKQPKSLEVVPAQASDKLQLAVTSALGTSLSGDGTVRGRRLHLFVQAFTGSGTKADKIRSHIRRANRTWAQAGIEVLERGVNDNVPPPSPTLLNLPTKAGDKPFLGILTNEERQLLGINPNGPPRSSTANDLNVYYVRSITVPVLGVSYQREAFAVIVEPGQAAIAISDSNVTVAALSHEIGHMILVSWPGQEHQDQSVPPKDWPDTNVMHPEDVETAVDVDQTQVVNILSSVNLRNNSWVLIEP
jgi:outer membrane protein OmpA-like peptidoglycan-associated protein/peptidoglycan hydrolase-like protein with peptidoglycan-binding domain